MKHITADFRARVLPNYADNGPMTNRYDNLLELIDQRFGSDPVADFGPRKLEVLRDVFITKGIGQLGRPNCRRQANELTRNVIAVIEHGVSSELVGPDRIVALRALPPLKQGQASDRPKTCRRPAGIDTRDDPAIDDNRRRDDPLAARYGDATI